VRQAIRWAIDYDAITEGIMAGAATKCHTFVPVGMPGHLDLLYHQDIEKAKQLMKEAGYEDGFQVELLTRTDAPYPDIAAQIKQDLKKINIDVKVTTMVYAELLKLYRAQQHQMVFVRFGADYADPSNLAAAFANCRTSGPEAEVKQIAWRNMYCPTGVTDWVEQAAGEKDSRKREILYKAIQAVVLEEGPYVILHNPLIQIAARDVVKGLQVPSMWYYTELFSVTK
jgi:peptide/nickel transport system substrate-binding protein